MTQEEKAKAYDRVSKEVKDFFEGKQKMYSDVNQTLEYLFPELKESEDERIRKRLIEYFRGFLDGYEDTYKVGGCVKWEGLDVKDVITWLEKQGEKSTLPKWKYKKDNTPLLRDSLILNKYGCVAKSPSGALVSDVWVIDYAELTKLPKEEIEKQGEQKPAWSEEDTRLLDNCISLIEDIDCTKEEQNWLKGIKDRIQPKREWSEEDERILVEILKIFNIEKFEGYNIGENNEDALKFLKSLKDRVQPKQEWSEEDDIMAHDIDYALRCQITYSKSRLSSMSSWIYELKNRVQPQNTWKPSDGQIKMLDKIIDVLNRMQLFGGRNALIDLKHDLKKLREE